MRSSRYAYALTIMTLLPVGAANAQMEGLEPALEPPAEVTLVSPVVELPVEFVNQLPTVQVTINGKGPYRFGIETGAPLVVLTPDTADAVKPARSAGPEA